MHQTSHPDHDVLLIAAHAADDLSGPDLDRAQALLQSCAPCADLHRDLVAIAAATRTLPALATAPRDFRLSHEQAARLRRGSWLRTVLAPFSGAHSALRPVAAGLSSLGVAGLLIATLLPGMLGSAATLTPERDQSLTGAGASAAPAAAPGATAAAGPDVRPVAGGPTAGPDSEFGASKDGTATSAPNVAVAGGASAGPGTGTDTSQRESLVNPPSPLFVGSLALLAVGLLLFGLRFAGRRLR